MGTQGTSTGIFHQRIYRHCDARQVLAADRVYQLSSKIPWTWTLSTIRSCQRVRRTNPRWSIIAYQRWVFSMHILICSACDLSEMIHYTCKSDSACVIICIKGKNDVDVIWSCQPDNDRYGCPFQGIMFSEPMIHRRNWRSYARNEDTNQCSMSTAACSRGTRIVCLWGWKYLTRCRGIWYSHWSDR